MRKQIFLLPILLFILAFFGNYILAESAFDHNYGDYTALLNKNVNNGKVDYKGIKSSNEDLNAVVSSFSAVTKEQYNGWSESQKLAFLINVYNAETLKLVAENYPLKKY